jgi:hypothetical protein
MNTWSVMQDAVVTTHAAKLNPNHYLIQAHQHRTVYNTKEIQKLK